MLTTKEQSEVVERLHRWRFFLVGRVLFRYLIVKLKLFAGSLLFALDHSGLSFCREYLRMNDIRKPCNYC